MRALYTAMFPFDNKPRTYGEIVTTLTNQLVAFSMHTLVALMYRVRCHYHKDYDMTKACLILSNHRSFLDPPLIGAYMNGNLTYFARRSLWKAPVLSTLLNLVGAIPVDRAKPALETFKDTIRYLQKGRSVLMFPEGTRSKDARMGKLRDGFALISRRAKVPIVPVFLLNTNVGWPASQAWPNINFAPIRIYFGAPVQAPAHLSAVEQERWLSTYVHRWMHTMQDKLQGPA